jgi:hypothetical protein
MRFPVVILMLLLAFSGPAPAGAEQAASVRDLLSEDRWEEALALAREQADRSDAEASTALGEALFRAGRLVEASDVLSRVVEDHDPPPVRALVQLGMLRLAEGRGREGSDLLNTAMQLAPEDPYVLFRAAGAAGERAEVIQALQRYVDLAGESDPDRVEAARGTIRFLAALGDRETWVRSEWPDEATLPLRAIPGKAGVVRGYTLKAMVGERRKPVRILLDTGSPGFYLDEKIARKHGMDVMAEATVFGGGGSGRHRSKRGLMSRLDFGAVGFRDVLASTSGVRLDPAASFQGLVGIDPFAGYIVTLDLARGTIRLETPPSTGDPWPGEGWSPGARYWTVSGQFLVEAGDAGGAAGLFILDTGATHSLVSENFVQQVDGAVVRGEGAVRAFGGVRPDSARVRGVDLRFQGMDGSAPILGVDDLSLRSRLSGVEICGFLGLDILAGKVIRIDTLARKVFVREQGRKP